MDESLHAAYGILSWTQNCATKNNEAHSMRLVEQKIVYKSERVFIRKHFFNYACDKSIFLLLYLPVSISCVEQRDFINPCRWYQVTSGVGAAAMCICRAPLVFGALFYKYPRAIFALQWTLNRHRSDSQMCSLWMRQPNTLTYYILRSLLFSKFYVVFRLFHPFTAVVGCCASVLYTRLRNFDEQNLASAH